MRRSIRRRVQAVQLRAGLAHSGTQHGRLGASSFILVQPALHRDEVVGALFAEHQAARAAMVPSVEEREADFALMALGVVAIGCPIFAAQPHHRLRGGDARRRRRGEIGRGRGGRALLLACRPDKFGPRRLDVAERLRRVIAVPISQQELRDLMGERACRAGRKRLRACSLPRTSGRPSNTFASSAASSAFLPCGAKRGRRSTRAWVCACCGDGSREARSGWFWLGLGWFSEEDVCAALACLFTRPVSAPAARRTRVTSRWLILHAHRRAESPLSSTMSTRAPCFSRSATMCAWPCSLAR